MNEEIDSGEQEPVGRKLEGKVAIVSGGSRGIGREIVITLAAEKAIVAFSYLKEDEAAIELSNEIRSKGGRVECFKVDVCNYNETQKMVKEIYEKYGRIDILVNNVGIARDSLLLTMSREDFDAVINTNLGGMFNLTQCVVKYMVLAKHGKIINISSTAGSSPGRGQCNYAASKGAVNAFTKALATELAPKNITVNAVAPGLIITGMSERIMNDYADQILKLIPLGRFGTPADVAKVVLFFASEDSDYITGEIVKVSGGFKM